MSSLPNPLGQPWGKDDLILARYLHSAAPVRRITMKWMGATAVRLFDFTIGHWKAQSLDGSMSDPQA